MQEKNPVTPFTQQEMKARAMLRIAVVLGEHAEEQRYPHSRIFETLMPDPWIVVGTSVKGGGWREHVVPCAYLARECIMKFQNGSSVLEVAQLLDRYLKIVHITREERQTLDFDLGLRDCMPEDWHFGDADAFARLGKAGIAFS